VIAFIRPYYYAHRAKNAQALQMLRNVSVSLDSSSQEPFDGFLREYIRQFVPAEATRNPQFLILYSR
jgi:hypothetical protein